MNKDEIPKRAPHHQEASASMTAAFATLPYPVTKQQAVEKLGDWKVPLAEGERVPLRKLLEGMPEEEFSDPTQAVRAVDQHWGRMVANLRDAE